MDIFRPVQILADRVVFAGLGLSPESYLGAALHFFVYDIVKIGLLLVGINFVMALVRYYFPMDKVKALLIQRRWYGFDYLLAALLGVITPFCSCSSIPLFIGFLGAGIPLGLIFTFLISSPLVNEASLYLFPVLFGWKVTLLYNLSGMGISIIGGLLISRLRMETFIKPELIGYKTSFAWTSNDEKRLPLKRLIPMWWREGMQITRQIFPYVFLGVGIGALIHGFVPTQLVEKYLSWDTWYAVPMATLLGIPLYANSVGVLPIMDALVNKGVPLGTVLAFMTAVVTLSVPEALMLKKVMKWQLLAAFFGITWIGIILIGFLFNGIF